MLYDAMIRNLSQAREAMMEGRVEDRYNKLVRVTEIIAGLQMSLDFDQGKEAAQGLYDFYSLLESRVMSLHRNGDVVLCDQLVAEVRDMREAWHQIDKNYDGNSHSPDAVSSDDTGSADTPLDAAPDTGGHTAQSGAHPTYAASGSLLFSA